MKKRVLQLIGSFHQGGTERQAVSLTRHLKDEGSFDVFAATLNNEGVLRSEMEEIGFNDIREFSLTSFYNVNFVRQARRCAQYLTENKIDIIHTHDFYTNVFGMAAATLAGVPVRIASKRETDGMRSRVQNVVENLAFGRANAIVANSAAVRDHLIGQSVSSSKVRIIYNGIDPERFGYADDRASLCRRLGLPTDENISFITSVANLRHKVKNMPMLLRSAKRVIEKHRNVHFVIAGEGELEAELKKESQCLGIVSNVHFIGRSTNVPALLSISSCSVLTSFAEGFSNSIIEYMAAGKPVVATNVGGAAEAIVENETGFLVASDDDEAMAARLVRLLGDPEMTNRFGTAGKTRVAEKFSSKTQLIRTLQLYNDLVSRRDRSSL